MTMHHAAGRADSAANTCAESQQDQLLHITACPHPLLSQDCSVRVILEKNQCPELLLDVIPNRALIEFGQVVGAYDHTFVNEDKSRDADTDSRQDLSSAFGFELIDRTNDVCDNGFTPFVKIGCSGALLHHFAIGANGSSAQVGPAEI